MRDRAGRQVSARRLVTAAALAAAALLAQPVGAVALPPPPPNPSDDEIRAGEAHAHATAEQVGRLANQVAEADAALLALQAGVALKREETNKALIELHRAQDAAAAAQATAERTRAGAEEASSRVAEAQRRIDEFAAGSYRQGSTLGSVSAFLGSESPEDLLARAELLESVGRSQLDVLDAMRRARVEAANQDAEAREALAAAEAARQVAARAKAAADSAYRAAVDAERSQAGQAAELQARKADLERQLFEAQNAVAALRGQRQRYEEWVAQREREEREKAAAAAAAARRAAEQAAREQAARPASGLSHREAVAIVLNRALSQLGVRYSWGGGDANGPTVGIRDGGIGDAFGDYRSVGFDCSGLMIYAFAPVLGYSLPHYSGDQYHAGRKVPLADKRPGDMLFWATNGRIHHVALYLGDEQMVEAPYSGSAVRVAPVRYGGIMPYVTRMF